MFEAIYQQFKQQGMRFYPHPDHGQCEYSEKYCAWNFANYARHSWAGELCAATMLEF